MTDSRTAPAKRKTITFAVEDFEYEEILRYARIKGHGGRHPASAFAHYAAIQLMKKYPASEAEIRKYGSSYGKADGDAAAVQPDPLTGNQQGMAAGKGACP